MFQNPVVTPFPWGERTTKFVPSPPIKPSLAQSPIASRRMQVARVNNFQLGDAMILSAGNPVLRK